MACTKAEVEINKFHTEGNTELKKTPTEGPAEWRNG